MIFDDDDETAKRTGFNISTGELVPLSYEPPDTVACIAAAVVAIIVVVYAYGSGLI